MTNYYSDRSLMEIGEGMVRDFYKGCGRIPRKVDIGRFINDYLKMDIAIVDFAEDDPDEIGFLSDGVTPLKVYMDDAIVSYVSPKDTIVLNSCLDHPWEKNRKRFTAAHEAGHAVINRMCEGQQKAASFNRVTDTERIYNTKQLHDRMSVNEWQANTLAASFLMPRFILDRNIKDIFKSRKIKVYGDNTFALEERKKIKKLADTMEVSQESLILRLKKCRYLDYHSIEEFLDMINIHQVEGIEFV